jgi:hypothetical protein
MIANSAGSGVVVTGTTTRAQIRRNSIFNNGTTAAHLGIDLSDDGVTANDTNDPDTGPNTMLNSPVLSSAGVGDGQTRLTGTLNSNVSTSLTLDFYVSPSCDASGNGEGLTWIGATSVFTNSSGNASFAGSFTFSATPGQALTVTATNTSTGVTSEFSECKTIVAAGIIVTPTSGLTTTEAGGTATFSVQLAAMPLATVTVEVSSSNTNEGTVSPQTLTFPVGATGLVAQTVTVTGIDDGLADGNVVYTILLAAATSLDDAYNSMDPSDVSVTNQDDEPATSLSVSNVQGPEGNSGMSSLAFTVTLSAASGQTVTVQYASSNGTATGGASCGAGVDYVNASGTLTFAPAETCKPVAVTVCGDAVSEPDETLTLTLANASNATISQASATGTIQNDEGAPALSVADAWATEGNSGTSPMTFTVSLSIPSSQPVTVRHTTPGGSAIVSATCTRDVDFTPANGTITFAPGETSKQVAVTICADTLHEPDETFTFVLSNPTNATIARATATGTIQNDDVAVPCSPRPEIRVTPTVNGGKLYVHIASRPLNTNQPNPLQQVTFGVLQNARVTLNGQQVRSNQTVSLPANTSAVDLIVERVTAGQSSMVPLTVVDGCGPWNTFVGAGTGGGTGNGF